MTRAHRTAHAWMWTLLAGVIAAVIIAGVVVRPDAHPVNDLPAGASDALVSSEAEQGSVG